MTTADVSVEVTRRRLHAQLLDPPGTGSPLEVTDHLLAVQSQDLRGGKLAVRARTEALTVADVDQALADRTLIVTWVNRGTLHLIRAQDYSLLQALTTPQLATGNARRLLQEGVPPDHADRAVEAVEGALADEGQLTRGQLKEVVDGIGVRTEGQALIHILLLATLRGLIVRGPMVGKEQAFVLVRDWLGPEVPGSVAAIDRGEALGELARRYLVGHGPATDRDLAKWAGLTVGDSRRGLLRIGSELEELDGGLVDLADRAPVPGPDTPSPTRLLGPFDALLMGWTSRAPVLGDNQSIVTSNGVFRPFALVDGRAVASWRFVGSGPRLSIEIDPFPSAAFRRAVKAHQAELDAEAADVVRFLNG